MAPVVGLNRISPGSRLVDNEITTPAIEVTTATITGSIVLEKSGENKYTITWTQPSGDDRALTIPAMSADDQFTFNDATQTLTNKALTGVTDLDMTSGNKTILDTIGSNTLTIGASGTTVTIAGNLTVSGTTTTVNTTTLNIADSLYVLNSDETGTPSQDSGFIVERGTSTNVGLLWDESADEFVFVNSSEDGTTAGNVTIASYANLQIAKTTGSSLVLDGDKSVTPGDGGVFHIDTHTITDSATSGSGTATKYTHVVIEAPTLAATNSSVTTSDVATFYISGAATAGSNQTLTRNYAMWVDAGNVRFDGSIYTGTIHAMNSSGLLQVTNQSNIAGVGTITSGTWQGTDVGVAHGGTGVSTLTDGGVLLGSGAGAITAMAVLADSEMIVGDGSTDPVAESGATLRTSIGVGTGDSPQFAGATLASSSADEPILHITNTHTGATSGKLRFNKDSGSGDDNDVMGIIEFYGTDAGEATHERLAYIDSYIIDSAAGSEAAGLRFYVAENDANLTAGLQIQGQADDDAEVDVIIAAGAASTTTIAGTLTMGSTATLTNAGLVAVANQANITGVGTISSGTWEGTTVAVDQGGTGATTLTSNAVLTGNGTSAIQAESDLLFSSNKLIPTASAHDAAGTTLTLSSGSTTAGTSNNQAGGALTIQGGQGKGSGAGGDIIFQTANAGGSGSSLNALATALTISDDLSATFAGAVSANAGVTVDNINIDGTEIDLSSGDLTIDVAGDIILSAAGGDVTIDDGSTTIFTFDAANVDFTMADDADTGDLFKVAVGAAGITALSTTDDDAGLAHMTIRPDGYLIVQQDAVTLDATLDNVSLVAKDFDSTTNSAIAIATKGAGTKPSIFLGTGNNSHHMMLSTGSRQQASVWTGGGIPPDGTNATIMEAISTTAAIYRHWYGGHYFYGDGLDAVTAENNLTAHDGGDPNEFAPTLLATISPTNGSAGSITGALGILGGIFVGVADLGDYDTFTGDLTKLVDDASNGAGAATLYIGNTSITTSSDRRIKKDIVDTSVNALDTLDKLRVVDFMWDDPTDIAPNNRNMRGQWTGMIAQEAVDVVPYIINAPRTEDGVIDYDDETTWTVDYQHLVPMLVKAIQELKQEIEELKGGN